MLITEHFVMLNFPKTGSSFARKVLMQLYANRRAGKDAPAVVELMMPKIDEGNCAGLVDQHGTLRQIPEVYRDRPVLSITRSPFSRYVSTYLYRWWAKFPPADRAVIRSRYPHFPQLSFREYHDMMQCFGRKNRLGAVMPKADVGLHTIQFIQFYFREPGAVLARLDDGYIDRGDFRRDMGPVTFLHQENLKAELKDFLLGLGMSGGELFLVDAVRPVNVTERADTEGGAQGYFDDADLRDRVVHQERLLFKLFPEYLPAEVAAVQPGRVKSTAARYLR